MPFVSRRTFGLGLGAAALGVTAPARAAGLDPVSVASVLGVGDATLLIAEKKGYFREQGIAMSLHAFNSGATMIAPLGAGQLDVGAGAPAAGLYNAMARGIGIKIVADRGRSSPGYGFNPIMVRKELVASGRYKGPADAKGLRFVEPGKGSTTAATIERYLQKGGLAYDDVQHVFLSFPDQVAALKNGSVDAAIGNEPWGTLEEREAIAVRVAPDDTFYPDHQIAVLMYSATFIKQRPDVARRFMVAYVKAARYYKAGLRGGHFAGPIGNDVITLLLGHTKADVAMLRAMVPGDISADGKPNVKSLEDDFAMFKRLGLTESSASFANAVDLSFVEAAAKQLGPDRTR